MRIMNRQASSTDRNSGPAWKHEPESFTWRIQGIQPPPAIEICPGCDQHLCHLPQLRHRHASCSRHARKESAVVQQHRSKMQRVWISVRVDGQGVERRQADPTYRAEGQQASTLWHGKPHTPQLLCEASYLYKERDWQENTRALRLLAISTKSPASLKVFRAPQISVARKALILRASVLPNFFLALARGRHLHVRSTDSSRGSRGVCTAAARAPIPAGPGGLLPHVPCTCWASLAPTRL